MKILIREVQASDYNKLKEFFKRNNTCETIRHFHPFPLAAETAWQIACMPKKDRYDIALLEGKIVGMCMLRGWDEGFSVPSFGILVDRRFRGKGIGRLLTEHAIGEAKKLGCHQIRLSVYASNVRAYHLYTSLGFREVKREVVERMGEKDIKLIMIKEL